jgi:hypothetical protein
MHKTPGDPNDPIEPLARAETAEVLGITEEAAAKGTEINRENQRRVSATPYRGPPAR